MLNNYEIQYTISSQLDIKGMRKYILDKFKYLDLAKNFDKKIFSALKTIQKSPTIYQTTDFSHRGYNIYMRCIESYLFFYIVENSTVILLRVLKDGMDWKHILELWLKTNNH